MKFMSAACAATLLILASSALAETPKTHTLPADAKASVIVMDHNGGVRRRVSEQPRLEIRADGTLLIGDPYDLGRKVEGKISGEELQEILRFILDEKKFAQITPDHLKLQNSSNVMDKVTSKLIVDADNAKKELSAYAIQSVAQQAGPNSPADHFLDIIKRLNQVIYQVILGGKEGMQKRLAAANEKLKADLPAEEPLQLADLIYAAALKEGSTVHFQRNSKIVDGKCHMISAVVAEDRKGALTVTVTKGPDVIQK